LEKKEHTGPHKMKHFPKTFLGNLSMVNVAVMLLIFSAGILLGRVDIAGVRDRVYRTSTQNNLPEKLDYSGIEEVYADLKAGFDGDLDENKLEDGLKQGLVRAAGDPHTEYLNAEASKEFEESLNGSFEGIGAELSKEKESIVIVAPIAGFPAEKAGLQPKDIVAEVDGETLYDMSVSEAVKKIRGPKGTSVKLGIIRDGKKLDFQITREQISIPSVTSEVADGNIGIIKISRFGPDTTQLARKAAADLKSKNVKGVVLDMRSNPGGLLDSAVEVSSLWLEKDKLILEEKRAGKVVKTFTAKGNPVLLGVPTVVMINEGSASASEIVAGALKDNNAASIVGQKSYGKGSVQEIRTLSDGGSLKVTIARWFTPAGRNIDKEGIEPDQKVEISEDDSKAKRDPQKDAALSKLR